MNTDNDYLVIWEFRVKTAVQRDFEKFYGPNGDWATLFRRSPEYLGTQLVHDIDRPERYLTLDRWTSREASDQFMQTHLIEYHALDKQCETLTDSEIILGQFELPSV